MWTRPALLHSMATEPVRQPPGANLPGCDARQRVVLVSLLLSEEQLKSTGAGESVVNLPAQEGKC